MANARVRSRKNRAEDYSYTIVWSDEDDAFKGNINDQQASEFHQRINETVEIHDVLIFNETAAGIAARIMALVVWKR